ncbi:MAG TPA: carboxypeptidase regulatory-like domain-containing protein [Terracidiphilus sp.]|jgi:hypothetical protein
MRSTKFILQTAVFCSLFATVLAQAAAITGTVTNKTTNKPSGGDTVVLVDVQAGMSEVAKTTTNAAGHYSLNKPGNGPYLVRVTHQGGTYFIAAPDSNAPGDIPVYDVAADINGVSIEADVIEAESDNGQLRVTERYFVHNTSSPPRTQYNASHGFEIVLPPDAVVDGTAARRPTGLPTSTNLKPAGAKGHFMFDFPIQPDEGEKDTLFQISYHVPYSSGKYNFRPDVELPADNVAVLLPMSIKFEGSGFQPIKQDPGIQTFLAKNVKPGGGLEFSVSGTGSMPREAQGQPQGGAPDAGSQDTSTPGNGPGGGIGQPINTPDPLSKYKWWILGALGLLLAAAAGFLLRKPAGVPAMAGNAPPLHAAPMSTRAAIPGNVRTAPAAPAPVSHDASLLGVLKDELFAIESERLSGTITAAEYAEQKAALETVLKRALKKKK